MSTKTEEEEVPRFTYEQLISKMKGGQYKSVAIMTGAGISVSAGIPDFRSPGTGLYDNLKEFDLPFAEAIFTIDYFQKKPQAFYKLAETFLDMNKYSATPTHHFCKLLHDKKILFKYMTQNIDNLESDAGFTQEDIVQAHGANFGATCSKCGNKQDRQKLEDCISKGEVMWCSNEDCKGPVKPDIVFFGEGLPTSFFTTMMALEDTTIDLLIVIGTALAVHPFASIVDVITKKDKCESVLINMENTATHGYDFDNAKKYPERLFIKGPCDETVKRIAKDLGWEDDLNARIAKKGEAPVKDLAAQMDNLKIDKAEEEKKEETSQPTKEEELPQIEEATGSTKEKGGEEEKSGELNPDEAGPLMGFFAVQPKNECPHCIPGEFIAPVEDFKDITISTPCIQCDHTKENWICLKCKEIGCSRYVNSHMAEHNKEKGCPIALSFADFSYWCYSCDTYVVSKHLNHVDHFYP